MEIYGADIDGINGQLIKFTATKDQKSSGVTLLGLAQKVVKEGFLRSIKAIETLDGDWSDILQNNGYTIQLSPAETPKTSSGLDLPIAIMLLQASILQNLDNLKDEIAKAKDKISKLESGKSKAEVKKSLLSYIEGLIRQRDRILKYRERISKNKNKYLLIGTFDIVTGSIQSTERGMFGMISSAPKNSIVIIPNDSEIHGAVVAKSFKNIEVLKANNLQEVWDLILGVAKPNKAKYDKKLLKRKRIVKYIPDLKSIEGIVRAKRAMMVAIAGGHNILLVGPPGQGKTMLAVASTKLLPELNHKEMFEVNKVYSAKGEIEGNEVILDRPFQEAASNITESAMFGGGGRPPVPGLVSLSHHGILLLDEINLFPSNLIEQLRNTLNNRVHKVQRVSGTVEYPCNFILVAAMNPCKCGWYEHYFCPECKDIYFTNIGYCPSHPKIMLEPYCNCKSHEILRFRDKLSKPLLDRIDLKVFLSPYDNTDPTGYKYASSTIKKTIQNAREIQTKRFKNLSFGPTNAAIPDRSQFENATPELSHRSFRDKR